MIHVGTSGRYLRQWRQDPPQLQGRPFSYVRRALRLPTFTLTQLTSVYPSRVQVVATNLDVGKIVTISRVQAGSTIRVPIRGANAVTLVSSSLILTDAEQPFGVDLTYYLTIAEDVDDPGADAASATTNVELVGGKVVMSDAISGVAVETVVMSWPSRKRTRPASVFQVGGRNIVVSGTRTGFESTMEIFTETDDECEAVNTLLQTATSGVIQIRQAGGYNSVDCYVCVQADDETRYSQDGTDQRRIISLDVIETSKWADTLGSQTFTLADIAAAYSGLTLAAIAVDYVDLGDLAQGDFSS